MGKGGMKDRPIVKNFANGDKYWEHSFDKFTLKVYVPVNDIDSQINNYAFCAPLLTVLEEKPQTMEEAIEFARSSGLASIAAGKDTSVLFIYPTCEGGWKNAKEDLYASFIEKVEMVPYYDEGICKDVNYFTGEFVGYFIRGAIFRANLYGYGESADYIVTHLLKKIEGEYIWGPGDITPAVCILQGVSVNPIIERKDIAIVSVGNSEEVNEAFSDCEHLLIKYAPEYEKDYAFTRQFKMWCGVQQIEPNFEEMGMIEEAGSAFIETSPDHIGPFVHDKEHKVGYFAYYNKDIFDNGPVPLVMGFHGGGDSAFFLTYVSGWYAVAHKYNFLYVAIENHQTVTATEVIEVIEYLKNVYNIDEKRIYATGFSMGSVKTWELIQEYPELFAGYAPADALFPMGKGKFSQSNSGRFNEDVPVNLFYSGGEASPLPELPCHADTSLDRMKYAARLNRLKKSKEINALRFEDRDNWENPIYGVNPDKIERLYDDTRDAYLTINYFESEDGVCRTAFASISGQEHELRQHTNEAAWKFISGFTK